MLHHRYASDYSVQREPKRLGDRLLEAGLISRTELENALDRQREAMRRKHRIGRILVDLGYLTERELTKMLSVHFAMPVAPFAISDAELGAVGTFPPQFARLHRLLPYRLFSGSLLVAAAEPVDTAVTNQMRRFTHAPVLIYLASEVEIEAALERFYGQSAPESEQSISLTHAESVASTDADQITSTHSSERRAMTAITMLQDIRERAQRYAAQTRELGDSLLRLADDNERLTLDLGASEEECHKLREENWRLKEEVENSRMQREELLGSLTRFTEDTLAKFRGVAV